MKKEIWVSVTSLILMTCFMIFATILYFNRRNMLRNTQIFNGEYTDMAFELVDNHIFVGDTDLSSEGYNQLEVYNIDLNLKYREKNSINLIVSLNYDNLDLDEYKDTIIYLKVSDKNNNIIREHSKLDLVKDKIEILKEPIEYSTDNYQYHICLEFYNKYTDGQIKDSYELANGLSADLI